MRYKDLWEGIFIERPNRFIARVLVAGKEEICHVKNTGRCRELLLPGARVYLERSPDPSRKTRYDVVSVYKGERLVNIDSAAPNVVAGEYLHRCFEGAEIRSETVFKNSRFDFFIKTKEKKLFVEAKGVTLERNNIAFFPDAPTVRGVKHLTELVLAKEKGYGAMLLLVVQMTGTKGFFPNDETDPAFGQALRKAREKGVEIRALECAVTPEKLFITGTLPLLF